MKILILSGTNHGFDKSARLIGDFLATANDLDISVEDSKDALTSILDSFDVCVFGTGFTHTVRDGDGRVFYTALGHGPDTFTRPNMQKLMLQGVRWAGGN